ncbi:G:T/U-mismatch repair DNA glycosylase [Bradyrhizobium sp. LM6.11]
MSDVPEQTLYRLPDQLRENLRLVFVGTAASTRSAELGHYYAHPGNRFWRAIHEAGITPRRYQPSEFAALLDLGIGFTDLSKSGAGMDHQIEAASIDVPGFKAKMENISAEDDCVHEQEGGELVLWQVVERNLTWTAASRRELAGDIRAPLTVGCCVRALDAGAVARACGVDRFAGHSTAPVLILRSLRSRRLEGSVRARCGPAWFSERCEASSGDGASRLLTMRGSAHASGA